MMKYMNNDCVPVYATSEQHTSYVCITLEPDKNWVWDIVIPIIVCAVGLALAFFITAGAISMYRYWKHQTIGNKK